MIEEQASYRKQNALHEQKASMTRESVSPPQWLTLAYQEIGQRRFPVGSSNPRIEAYNAATSLKGYDDKISWCSSFVNWCLAGAGFSGTGSALAKSWLTWGEPIDIPILGCIAIVSREGLLSWKGHVGFFIESCGEEVILLGGNQDETVKLKAYPRHEVLGFRAPDCSPLISGR
jgi:uncharacterized protein (TIGR02594 family)